MFQEAVFATLATRSLLMFRYEAKLQSTVTHPLNPLQTQEPIPVILYDQVSPHHTQGHIQASVLPHPARQRPQIALLRLDKRLCHHHDVEVHWALGLRDIDRGAEVLQLQGAHQQRCAWVAAPSTGFSWDWGVSLGTHCTRYPVQDDVFAFSEPP